MTESCVGRLICIFSAVWAGEVLAAVLVCIFGGMA